MSISGYISDLLEENEYVIVPGFGAFTSVYHSAEFDEIREMILPPSRLISFNPDLKINDRLLAGYLVRQRKISLSRANQLVEQFADDLLYRLDHGETVEMEGLGTLTKTGSNFIFIPNEGAGNLADAFGLEDLTLKITEPAVESTLTGIQQEIKRGKRKKRLLAGLLVFSVVLLSSAALIFLLPERKIKPSFDNADNQLGQDSANDSGMAELADSLALPGEVIDVQAADTLTINPREELYFLVGGSFKSKQNADDYFTALAVKGYHPIHLGLVGSFYIVAIDSFKTASEAHEASSRYTEINPGTGVWIYHYRK